MIIDLFLVLPYIALAAAVFVLIYSIYQYMKIRKAAKGKL